MQNLSLAELVQVVEDLLKKRGDALARVAVGPVFKTLFEKAVAEYGALPAALRGVPMADMLAAADATHDAWLRSVYGVRDLIRGLPTPSATLLAAADVIDDAFGTFPRELSAPYALEAQRAADRVAKVAQKADALAAVPTPDGQTLWYWVESYLAAGRALGELLSSRADEVSGAGTRAAVGPLRSRLMGLLSDLRTNVRREIEVGTGLGAEVDAALFGYADEVARLAEARAKNGATGKPAVAVDAPVDTPAATV